jgi:hypothetical protein
MQGPTTFILLDFAGLTRLSHLNFRSSPAAVALGVRLNFARRQPSDT